MIITLKVYDRMMTQIEQKNVLQVQIKNIKWSCVNLKKTDLENGKHTD